MGRLKETREKLVADLEVTGVAVMDVWRITGEPPCILLVPPPGRSYVEGGKTFGEFLINVDVVVLVRARPPNEGRDELEELLEDVLRNTADWALDGVDSPAAASIPDSTVEFRGAVVHLSKPLFL